MKNYYTEAVEDTENTESQTTDETEPQFMNDQEKKVFKNFMYQYGHCLAYHIELEHENCHCIEGLMIQESIQDYVFKKCQQECQQKTQEYWENAIKDANYSSAEEAIENEETDIEDKNYDSDDSGVFYTEPESDDEEEKEQEGEPSTGYRSLNKEEQRELINWNMQQQRCPFCEQR